MKTASQLTVWTQAVRPRTLSAAVVPVMVGTALVAGSGYAVDWWVSGFALLGAVLIQVGTNLFNDAFDFERGADTGQRVGPRRVTQSGLVSSKTVYSAALAAFLLAFVCGIPLVFKGGWPIVVIGLVSLLMGYAYTGGPFPLAYKGLGELFVIVFFGVVAVGGVYYLHTLQWSWAALVAGLQIGCLATVLLAVNNLRDREEDSRADKKTLAVRLGPKWARHEVVGLFVCGFVLSVYWLWMDKWLAALLPLVVLPRAYSVIRGLYKNAPGQVYNQYLAQSAAAHTLFGLHLSLGLLLP